MVRLIRTGGTCQVWEAVRNGQRVAVKFLQPEVRTDKEEIGYLRHELEVGQTLHHPNVIEIYDFAIDRSIAFLVMEYHPGRNIKMLLRLGIETFGYMVPAIITNAALGLQYLHEQGWVHRDIKPDNFLVTEDGDVKLIDFALAQRVRTGLSRLFGGRSKVQGTRSYMAPEQIRGKALDGRTDVYSFGCLLYELLSGKLPFTGISPEELLRKHLTAAIPVLLSANKNITPDFSDLVAQMMAKDPNDRPQSMEEFLRYFQSVRVFRAIPKPPTEQGADAHR
jgi:eukaryotic-like serine/threonine-protein kinase